MSMIPVSPTKIGAGSTLLGWVWRAHSGEDLDVQLAGGIPLAQQFLVKLADAGLGNLVDERPALRHLPLGDLATEELLECGSVDGRVSGTNHRGQWSLAPLLVRNAHHGGLEDIGVSVPDEK